MILGANIGTTIDAALAAIGTKTTAKRAALVHVLFNVIGTLWALPLLRPLLALVELVTPGTITPGLAQSPLITAHLAMLHTVFNVVNTLLFLPFVKPFAALVSLLIKEDKTTSAKAGHYRLTYFSGAIQHTPEFNIVRAEKEIRDMAGLASSMYASFSGTLRTLRESADRQQLVTDLVAETRSGEEFADEMREELTRFLLDSSRQLSGQSERNVYYLMRIIADLEDMTDDCYSVSLMLERSVRKDLMFKQKEVEALLPYISLVEGFLVFVRENLGRPFDGEKARFAADLEDRIDKSRDRLRKLGRKRIEAGEDVKRELLFIDLVRRIEKLGDICYNIAEVLSHMRHGAI